MASTSCSNTAPDDEEEDKVEVECREPEEEQNEATTGLSEITISTADIPSWNLSAILSHDIVKVKASRNRLIQQSSYFRGLLSGSFSESSKTCVSIRWSLRTFLQVLRFMYGAPIKIRRCNVLPLFQAALYFGAEIVLSECRTWISDNFSHNAVVSTQIQLDELILFWNFGIELGVDLITWHCISYMARNFMCAMACDSFIDVPYNLLLSCIKHPDLTVNSERHLAEALLSWIYAHADEPKHDESSNIDWTNILKQIRVYILPLWFLMGKLRCQYFSEFIEQSIDVIFSQCQQSSIFFKDVQGTSSLSSCSVRITEFTKKLDLSGCPQINKTNFYLLPFRNCVLKDGPMPTSIDLKCLSCHDLGQILSFKSVVALDISKCPNLRPVDLLAFLSKLFPSLRNLKVAYFSGLETRYLQKLMECHPSLDEVDLRVDIGPIIPLETPILYSELESIHPPTMYFGRADPLFKQPLSALTKLTLRGRTDVNDLNLLDISECFASLCYLDIKGCFSVTDAGISHCISRCANLHSFIASDTRFGKYSTSALLENSRAEFYTINLQLLHIGGCKGVDEASLLAILSQAHNLTSLCLRDTCLIDNALCNFTGSSLEKLNVSNTGISGAALLHIISRNPQLKCLKARGCKGLSLQLWEELSMELGKRCNLEWFGIGWGFSLFSLDTLAPAIRSLKALTVGLGGSLGEQGLLHLTSLCPNLESITLLFQVVSDYAMIKLMETLRNLRALELCYCIGDLSPLCFKFIVPSLRKLKLERVTPWMTNQDLTLLTQNFPNLMELSLIGCRCLDPDSQEIISYGWPALISLCLEECGGITLGGVCSLFNCKALENLLLKHNGCGIEKNFILDAASKLPMLRNLSVDCCDAIEGDFDLPKFGDKGYLSSVKISRCKFEKCSLEVQNVKVNKKRGAVPCKTLILVWNSTGLHTTLVKGRIS